MAKQATKKSANADALFDALSKSVEPVAPKESKKKKNRPQIALDESEEKAFETFCASDVILKMSEGRQKSAKAVILPVLRRKLLESWMYEGHRTDNPVVMTDKARANFVVRDILKVEVPGDGTVKDRLVEVGFDEEDAELICEKEFSERVEMNFRSLNELRHGEPSEQKVVKKLLQLVIDNFSAEEQKLLLRKETKVEVNEGFLDRAVQYCEDSGEKLDALLTVVQPQWVLSHMTYSGQDLNRAVTELTGETPVAPAVSTEEEFFSTDRKWKAIVKGSEALLYRVGGEGEHLIGTKKCNGGSDHAKMTCQKWLRDESYRNSFIGSN